MNVPQHSKPLRIKRSQSTGTKCPGAIVASKAKVSAAHSQVDAIKASIERIKFDMDDAQLRAPLKARVQFRVAQPGELVAAGGRVLNLIDLSDVYMTFFFAGNRCR